MKMVYYNGEWLPMADAGVSVMDRGFLFGDAVYEVIPTRAGRALFFYEHIARLANSLRLIGIPDTVSVEEWRRITETLLSRRNDDPCCVYIQISRGIAPIRSHEVEPERPTVLAMLLPAPARREEAGARAVTLPDYRWRQCHIKSTSLLANVLLRRSACAEGADEAILLRDDWVTEGSASNVFVLYDGQVMTAPVGENILSGVTRAVLIDLLRAREQPCEEINISAGLLMRADEIWLTSSTGGITPVVTLDGRPVGDGAPGPLWRKVVDWFDERERREWEMIGSRNGV